MIALLLLIASILLNNSSFGKFFIAGYYFLNLLTQTLDNILPAIFNKGFLVRVKKNRSYIKINFFKNGCKISLSGYEIKNKEYLVSKINKIPSLFFKNLKEIEYKKIMLNVPSQPEKYLEYVYKDWKIKNNIKFYYNLKYYRHDTLYTFFFKMRRILHLNGD